MVEYRGKIPFLLKELKGNILYLCSSNKNIEDYYNVLEDIYGGKLLKLESSQIKEELEKDNYDLLEILKSGDKFIILTSLDAILRDYFLEGKRFRIEIGKNIDAKTLEEELERNGYTRNYMVEDRNQFSIRGDIFDIFQAIYLHIPIFEYQANLRIFLRHRAKLQLCFPLLLLLILNTL